MEALQVKSHNSSKDCWIIIDGKVYNVTKYLDDHPGGAEIILELAGGDATREFTDIGHSNTAKNILESYEIGVCTDYEPPVEIKTESIFHKFFAWVFPKYYMYLGTDKKQKPVTLTRRDQLTHDTIHLVFEIPDNMLLGIECGQHIMCHLGDAQRKYTPIANKKGEFELVVKVYPNGKLSSHLNSMKIGDELLISGPYGRNIYNGNGEFSSATNSVVTNNVLFICAGSGITPVYAILDNINKDAIYSNVLFVNKTENDIIMHKELDEMCERNGNVKNYYALTQPGDGWSGLVGRPSATMITDIVGEERSAIVVICGSTEFNDGISKLCTDLGFREENLIVF